MFAKEDFKTIKEQERIVAKDDIAGQKTFLDKPKGKKPGGAAMAAIPSGGHKSDSAPKASHWLPLYLLDEIDAQTALYEVPVRF